MYRERRGMKICLEVIILQPFETKTSNGSFRPGWLINKCSEVWFCLGISCRDAVSGLRYYLTGCFQLGWIMDLVDFIYRPLDPSGNLCRPPLDPSAGVCFDKRKSRV
jgi:hypothetical protein